VTPRRIGVRTLQPADFREKARMTRTKAFAALGALAMIAAACSGDRAPLAPESAAPPSAVVSADRPGTRTDTAPLDPAPIGQANPLIRAEPLGDDISVTQIIGPAGGELEIPQAGLHVFVPRGALQRSTAITATALKGDLVAYEFGPHGTRFALPLVVLQKTAGTDFASLPMGTLVQGGYFTGRDALDPVAKKVKVAEVIPTLGMSTDDGVAFLVWHFSGYSFQWGFKGDDHGNDDDH
jgi:hypothetical protein